jgi:hypothetical protein
MIDMSSWLTHVLLPRLDTVRFVYLRIDVAILVVQYFRYHNHDEGPI